MAFRYIVQDVDNAIECYGARLGFALVQQFAPAMDIVSSGNLQRGTRDIWHLISQ